MGLRVLSLVVIATFLGANFLEVNSAVLSPSLEAQCTKEQYRLRYHFSPRRNWNNDPNGLVYYKGIYHLSFQYHPYSINCGPMHWGHAVSRDLFSWEELDIALYPDEVGDMFSGSSVVDFTNSSGFKTDLDMDPLVAIYTSAGVAGQSQSLAYSNDNGVTFTKYPGNPVIPNPAIEDFRDPKVSYIKGKWVMTLAVWNRVEFYGSPDLKSWTKLSEFGADVRGHDGVWECPDLFPLTVDVSGNGTSLLELWVLIVSVSNGSPAGGTGTQYFIGNFDGTTFTTFPWETKQWFDNGPDNYAAISWANEPQGRVIMIGWMNNRRYSGDLPTGRCRGQMTLPRTMNLHVLNHEAQRYRLTSMPVEEVKTLRDPLQIVESEEEFTIAVNESVRLMAGANFSNPGMELEITLEIEQNPQFSICAYNSLEEEVCFGFEDAKWYLDRSRSGNTNFHGGFAETLRWATDREVSSQEVTIRMFLDVSSAEVFADNGLTVMTSLFYATEPLDRFYIKHSSSPVGSDPGLKVKTFTIWGLKCTFFEDE